MNISKGENSLLLSKLTSEITSQLLIQSNDQQEYIQIPSISDDLLLTSSDDGTIAWTLGGLPVLLNGDTDQPQLFLNNLPSEESERDADPEDTPENLNSTDNASPSSEETYPLEIPDKGFLTENGLFITNEALNHEADLSADCDLVSNDNNTFNSENENEEETLDANIMDEIQSSDISSQEAFIDINGMLIPHQSIINLNNQDYFNIRDQSVSSASLLLNNISNEQNKCMRKISKSLKVKRKVVMNETSSGENLVQNYYDRDDVQNLELRTDNSQSLLFSCGDPTSTIKILNLSDPNTVLNVENALLSSKSLLRNNSDIVACDGNINEDMQTKLTDEEEPDSTVANDPLNIDDLATVITAYQCKKCDFTCNDREQFLNHFKDTHMKSVNKKPRTDSSVAEKERVHTVKFICNNNELNLNLCEVREQQLGDKEEKVLDENSQLGTINIIYTNEDYSPDETTNNVIATLMQEQDVQEMENNIHDSNIQQNDLHTNVYIEKNPHKTQNIEEELNKKIMRLKRRERKSQSNNNKRTSVAYVPEQVVTAPEEIFEAEKNDTLNDCSIINEEFTNKNETANNTKNSESQEKQLIYLCSQCADQFLTVEECRIHMIKDHNLCAADDNKEKTKTLTENCESDDKPLYVPDNAETELQKKNKRTIEKFLALDTLKHRKHKCTVRGCPYRFARPELKVRHESCHVNSMRGSYICTECGEKQGTWRMCSLHLWRAHQIDLDLYACPLCNFRGTTYMKLKQHLKIHGDEREYICGECGRGFKQASQLRNHRVMHLDRRLGEAPMWYIQKYCEKCGKMFADSKCLKKHIQAVHSKLKPFICNVCGHCCARKAMLQMHLRQHTGEKPYACKLCFYKTGDHNSLRRHMMRHSGVRPYKCPHCDYTAIQSNSYKNHLANKHPGMSGSYNCTECPFKTVNEEAFSGHQNDHRNGLINTNKNNSKDLRSKITNALNVIYDLNTSSSDASISNENTIYTLSSSPQKIIFVSGLKKNIDVEDDETQNCYLSLSDLTDEQTVDTGGITIPADPDVSIAI